MQTAQGTSHFRFFFLNWTEQELHVSSYRNMALYERKRDCSHSFCGCDHLQYVLIFFCVATGFLHFSCQHSTSFLSYYTSLAEISAPVEKTTWSVIKKL